MQKILKELSETDPPLLWRAGRGDYALYDQSMQNWYAALCNSGQWPVTGRRCET